MKLTPLSKMKKRIKVKDHPNLERDPKTNAIVSTDNTGYQKYMNQKEIIQRQQDRIEYLESEIIVIKQMLMNK
jgi:hypothetical protein|tara:strand:+ start:2277 stop:2495 length:219 start_codon:yes stop_codon:yes gene_type:complete